MVGAPMVPPSWTRARDLQVARSRGQHPHRGLASAAGLQDAGPGALGH